jgi:glycosyltransferase involved in cell wall biosynthesis
MLTGAYYPEISGGGLQARELIRNLRGDVDFRVLTTSLVATEHTQVDGIPVSRILVDLGSVGSRARGSVRLLYLLLRFVREADIVHLQAFSRKNIVVAAVATLLRKPILLTLQTGVHDDAGVVRSETFLGYWSFKAADAIVAVSEALREAAERAGISAHRLRTVPNGVDTSRFRPATNEERTAIRRRLSLPECKTIILFVGFFSREKGPHRLFEAWKQLPQSIRRRTVLLFIGRTTLPHPEVDPTLVEAITRESQGFDTAPVFVERTQEIESYYRAADLFVLPSTREGCPNALLEAMATGLPAISTRLTGVTDSMITDRANGRLVEPEDVEALRNALEDVLSNAADAASLGIAARGTACHRFHLDVIGREYFTIYQALADAAPMRGSP